MFAELVEAASVDHVDIGLCRDVIKTMPRKWVVKHIEPIVDQVISSDPKGNEFYQRYAELYLELDDSLLRRLIERAERSESATIREVAVEFKAILECEDHDE